MKPSPGESRSGSRDPVPLGDVQIFTMSLDRHCPGTGTGVLLRIQLVVPSQSIPSPMRGRDALQSKDRCKSPNACHTSPLDLRSLQLASRYRARAKPVPLPRPGMPPRINGGRRTGRWFITPSHILRSSWYHGREKLLPRALSMRCFSRNARNTRGPSVMVCRCAMW